MYKNVPNLIQEIFKRINNIADILRNTTLNNSIKNVLFLNYRIEFKAFTYKYVKTI